MQSSLIVFSGTSWVYHKHGFPSSHESLLCEIEFLFYIIEEIGKEQRNRKRGEEGHACTTIINWDSLTEKG